MIVLLPMAAIVLTVGIEIAAPGIRLLHTFWWLYFSELFLGPVYSDLTKFISEHELLCLLFKNFSM